MYCPYCGKQVKSEAKFCQYCGRKIETASDSSASRLSGGSSYFQDDYEQMNKGHQSSAAFIVTTILLSAAVGIGAFFLITRVLVPQPVVKKNDNSGTLQTASVVSSAESDGSAANSGDASESEHNERTRDGSASVSTTVPTNSPIPTPTQTKAPTQVPTSSPTPAPAQLLTPVPTSTPLPTSTPVPVQTPVPAPVVSTITIYCGIQVPETEFDYPESSSRQYTKSEFDVLFAGSARERYFKSQVFIDEIFVRYGYVFSAIARAPAKATYEKYRGRDWYEQAVKNCPTQDMDGLMYNYMTSIERYNIGLVNEWQSEVSVEPYD